MSARDRTREILQVKQRSVWGGHGIHSYRLEELKRDWERTSKNTDCLPDFYLIRAVTILEVSTRQQISGLIDHAEEFANRAIELSKSIKIDLATVRDVQGRVITLGDIVAHSVPINSFGQILGCFETLLGKPLSPLLGGAVDRWRIEIERQPPEPIIPDFDALAGRLSHLFTIRHILCHEMPDEPVYSMAEVGDFLSDAAQFARALEEVVSFEKYGLVSLSQADQNREAILARENKDRELNDLLARIRGEIAGLERRFSVTGESLSEWLSLLDTAQEKWLSYRRAHCEFANYSSREGSIRTLSLEGDAVRMTMARISEIQSWLDNPYVR